MRQVNINGRRNNNPWFTEEVKETSKQETKSIHTIQKYENFRKIKYKIIRDEVNQAIKKLKKNYWESFSTYVQHDPYEVQKKVQRKLTNRKKKQ